MTLRLLLALLGSILVLTANAHEVRPGYLELSEHSSGRVSVLWKHPAQGELIVALAPRLPEHCRPLDERQVTSTGDALVMRWQVDCGSKGLTGSRVAVDGLELTLTDVLLRLVRSDGVERTWILRPSEASVEIGGGGVHVPAYLVLGVEHLLFGPDHLLFVIGLMLLIRTFGALVATITSFTIAHSITLSASVLGGVSLPSGPVEAIIALSILLLVIERVRAPELRATSLTVRRPWFVAFAFGLLHGFGFAADLEEIGLPAGHIPAALALFNVGIELGQLIVVAVALLGYRLLRASRLAASAALTAAPVYAMGAISVYWFLDRLAEMLV